MRVALVSGYDWEVFGGVQSQVRDLARALSELGESVRLVCPGSPPGAGNEAPFLIEVTGRSRPVSVNGSRAPVSPGPASFLKARRALSSFVPDVVHVHEPLLPGPPLAAVLSRRAPVVGTFHRAGSDSLYRLEGRVLGPLVASRLAATTAVSEAAAETAGRVLQSRVKPIEIPNGVDVDRLSALARDPGHDGLKTEGGPVVVFLGRLEARKGAGLLLEAFGRLAARPRLLLVGDGPERPGLEAAAAPMPEISFLGALSDEEAAERVASADCFVAPALSGESFGIVLLEAMALGTAVVASDLPGYARAAGKAAELFRTGDSGDLARALSEVLARPKRRQELVAAGRERAAECSMTEVARRYLEVYRDAAEA